MLCKFTQVHDNLSKFHLTNLKLYLKQPDFRNVCQYFFFQIRTHKNDI